MTEWLGKGGVSAECIGKIADPGLAWPSDAPLRPARKLAQAGKLSLPGGAHLVPCSGAPESAASELGPVRPVAQALRSPSPPSDCRSGGGRRLKSG